MIYNHTELAELICTRISHDLIGNIGALSSAMELVRECGNVLDEDTKNILQTAADTLKARQKFFRVAFGVNNANMKNTDLVDICKNYLTSIGSKSAPITFDCNNSSEELSKVICLSVMLGAEVCIKGGHIGIEVSADSIKVTVKTDYKLSGAKLLVYQDIVNGIKPEDNASQYAALIYFKELLGADVKFSLEYTDRDMALVIG